MGEKAVLVTGANKGIGLAICAQILAQHSDTKVFLGSRDPARGEAAAASLGAGAAGRVSVVPMDVADDTSIAAAAATVSAQLGGSKLYGIVNNAGVIPAATGESALGECLNVNVRGCKRVVDSFLPLLEPSGGRVVFISSASGPTYVQGRPAEVQRQLTDPAVGWADVEAAMAAHAKDAAQDTSQGYGLSKACLNMYNHLVAREHPSLIVNACTPGFIETDLTRPMAARSGRTPEQMGMKPPKEGTLAAMKLLFGDVATSGRYYGSDGVRSPLHKYRAPGDPPYTGD